MMVAQGLDQADYLEWDEGDCSKEKGRGASGDLAIILFSF